MLGVNLNGEWRLCQVGTGKSIKATVATVVEQVKAAIEKVTGKK